MLDTLGAHDIRATYFIEAWNCTIVSNREAVQRVKEAGHEVGFHAWQHEVWKTLDGETEVSNLDRSVREAGREGLGIVYRGFRPPGGLVTDRTLGLMRERGFTYLSPAAERVAVVDGIAMLPFQWRDIDAYFYMEGTKALRTAKGDSEEVLEPRVLKERVIERIDQVVGEGGYLSLLFHPFLQTSAERMDVFKDVVAYLAEKRDRDNVWMPSCAEAAEFVLSQGEGIFGTDPGWDTAEWKKK